MVDVKLPQFGMGMTEGTITAWRKAEGDLIQEGEIIADVEAAKATCEIAAPASGKLVKILVQIDETVPVYTVIAYISNS
jgi:pyruvate/2-oxoglutarate dehydrogenase complex dihydrolipoamide acyltransferase (E2) component